MVRPDSEDDVSYINITKDGLDVQAYVHHRHRVRQTIVAVRGSESNKWDDWVKNISFRSRPIRPRRGRAHRGFYAEAEALGYRLISGGLLDHNDGKPYEIILTGHSKGGSICTVLKHIFKIRAVCHTFGECRSLNGRAARLFARDHREHYRWVNTVDPVPKLLWWCYRHVGHLIYLDRKGRWNYGYVRWWDRLVTRIRNPLGGIPRHSMSRYRALVTGAYLSDEHNS